VEHPNYRASEHQTAENGDAGEPLHEFANSMRIPTKPDTYSNLKPDSVPI